mgnify:CR=1 FL=1
MLHYKIYQNKSKGNKAYGKWFARATGDLTRAVLTSAAQMQEAGAYDPSKGAVDTGTPTTPDGKSVAP